MSSIVIAGDTSGSVTLQAPAVAGTTTLNLPSSTGTIALTSGLPSAATTSVLGTVYGATSSASPNSTFLGYQAGFTDTTGVLNTFIGYQSAYLSNGGSSSNNTCVGAYAGYSLSTGVSNTFVGSLTPSGQASGASVTTGSKNTIIGNYTGNLGSLDIRTLDNYVVLSDGSGNPLISTNSTRSVALNGAVPQTGTGITFPATQSASSNANTLDDYEEGTWTPIVSDAASGGNLATLTDAEGVYTKIGNVVYWRFNVVLSSKASMTAGETVFIQGFPFQSATIPNSWYNPSPVIIRNITFTGYVQFNQVASTTRGSFRENVSNANGDDIIVSDLTNSAAMQVSGFYRVA